MLAGGASAAHAEFIASQTNPAEAPYAKGRLLIQPRAGVKLPDLDGILRAHGARRGHAIPQLNVHIVELPEQADEHAMAQLLARLPQIKSAELDRLVRPAFIPNDAGLANAWHLPKIGSPSAWDYSNGSGVIIAILDSGVDPTHPDLVQNLVPGYNFYDNNTDTQDVNGHGTKVAGTAAMAGNNAIGSAGVAYASRIMPIRVSDANGFAFYSTLAQGITYAADHGAKVASMSFSGVCGSSTLISAAQYMRSKGGVVIGAAGNSGVEEAQVVSDAITCVSATDPNDLNPSWSSFGAYVDVAAPGLGIYTSSVGGGYASVSGTSFSAPMTAGVYALMMAANPQLTPSQLDAALFSTAVDLGAAGKDVHFGYGRIDAAAAVAQVSSAPAPRDTTPPSVSIVSPAPSAQVKGAVAVDVSASDNVGVTRVELYAAGKLVASDITAPYAFTWDSSGLADGPTTLQAKAFDAAGNFAGNQINVNVANTVTGGGGAPAPGSTNVALASAGAVASASSESAGYAVSGVVDNRRSGATWGVDGGWNDATPNVFPDWAQVTFNGPKSIDRVVVYSVQDNYTNPVEPTDTMTFSLYGLVDFEVQGWNGSSWVTLASVTGNNLVKRTVSFPAFTTDRIRVFITNALSSWSRITEIEAWGVASTGATAPGATNVALASAGAVASASSASVGYPVSAAIDNRRSGATWGVDGGWNDATPGAFPDWLQVSFSGPKSIDRVVVYSVQDNYINPVEPTDTMTFSLYGLVDFEVQGWNGSSWVTLASVTGNNLVKRTVSFPAFTTDRIRLNITNALSSWSRVTEIEAWGR